MIMAFGKMWNSMDELEAWLSLVVMDDYHPDDCSCESCSAWNEEYAYLMQPHHYYER